MARIGLTLSGIERRLLSSLAAANAEIALSSYRMATGHKINAAADNPSTFVYLSGLQSQLGNVTATLANVTAAGSVVAQVQSGISSIQTQLETIRTELLKDKNEADPLTPAERAEAQVKIDAAIAEISTMVGTPINGRTLLSGAANYYFGGLDADDVAEVSVYRRAASGQTISGNVTDPTAQAELTVTGEITEAGTLTLTGSRGALVVELELGDTMNDVAEKVNNYDYQTGVTAAADGNVLTLTSVDYGSSASVQVQISDGGTFVISDEGYAVGTNAAGTINGITFSADSPLVSGNRFSVSDNGFQFDIEFQPGFDGVFNEITVQDGGVLSFSLTENLQNRSELGIPGLFPVELGGLSGTLDQLATGGILSGLGEHASQAIRVVDEALGKITRVDGLVDGFYNASIDSASALMTDLQDKLTDAIDSVDQVDDYEELQIQVHYQTLADNSVAGLTLLNQQRTMLSKMLLAIAGLD